MVLSRIWGKSAGDGSLGIPRRYVERPCRRGAVGWAVDDTIISAHAVPSIALQGKVETTGLP
jgi:hypothetical protein